MGRNYDIMTFISKFSDIIKIAIMVIKTTFKDSKKFKKLEIMD